MAHKWAPAFAGERGLIDLNSSIASRLGPSIIKRGGTPAFPAGGSGFA